MRPADSDRPSRTHSFTRKKELIAALVSAGFDQPAKEYMQRYKQLHLSSKHPRQLRFNLVAISLATDLTGDALLFAMDDVCKDDPHDTSKASFTAFAGCHTDLKAAITLVAKGFDLQARNLLRSCRERIDVLGACLLDEEFASAYIAAQDFKSANRFWYERVRKGRARKSALEAFMRATGATSDLFEGDWADWRAETDEMLSAAEHVLPAAFFLALFPGAGTKSQKIGLDGAPSNVSLRTISTMMFFLFEIFMFTTVALPELKIEREDDLMERARKSFHRSTKLLMMMIGHMYRYPDTPFAIPASTPLYVGQGVGLSNDTGSSAPPAPARRLTPAPGTPADVP